jgi:hypothetical protein
MRLNRNVGMILLAIFLILYGLNGFGLTFPGMVIILALLALLAGILILIAR